jgi:hypothetical protein
MFLPLVLVSLYRPGDVPLSLQQAGGVTVGIAIILRATTRRLFRAAARSVMRSTVSTLSRASARTFTRRFVRLVMHSLFGIVTRNASGEPGGGSVAADAEYSAGRSMLALAVSIGALAFSFWGVLQLLGPANTAALTVQRGLSVPLACLLATAPIICYALVMLVVARSMHLRIRFAAELDALLLQAYFTGAGSFLPMTTDFEYDGNEGQRARLAGISLGALFLVHVVLYVLSAMMGSYPLKFASAMFLIYCFVYAFPLKPLEGHDLWKRSKLLWTCAFAPIFVAFVFFFPEELTAIL